MKPTSKDIRKLAGVSLFSRIPSDLLSETIDRFGGGVREYGGGEVIFSPLADAPQVGVLLSGRAAVSTPSETRSVLLRFLSAGDAFGISNLFSEERFLSLIRTETACRCFLLSQEAIGHLLDHSPEFRRAYVGFLSDRVRFLNRKIGYLTAGSAERRLALYLASLGEGEVRLQDSITSLSDLLNLGRASLYRAFDRLCEDGFLIRNGRNLTILDREAMLRAYK